MKKRFRRLVSILLMLMLLPLSGCSNDGTTAADTTNSMNNSINGGYVVETPDGNYFLSNANEQKENILYKIDDDQIEPTATLRNDYKVNRPCMNYYDGKIILYLSHPTNPLVYPGLILSVDPETGDQEVLLETVARQIYVSGDQMFYLSGTATDVDKNYINSPVLRVYDLKTGEDKEIMQANCGDAGYFFFLINDRVYFVYGEPGSAINSKVRSAFDLNGNEIDDDPIVEVLSNCLIYHVQVDSDTLYFVQGNISDFKTYNNLYSLSLDDLSISEIYSSDLYNSNSFCLVDDYIILLRSSYQSGSDQLIRMSKSGDDQYIYTKRPASIKYGNFGMASLQVTSNNVYLYEKGDTDTLQGTEDIYLEWISLEDLGVIFEGQISYN